MDTNKITIKLTKSVIGCTKKQLGNVKGLGLKKINSVSILPDTRETHGMIKKINHLVEIQQ